MEKFFCPVCKTIRPDRRISFLRNPFCTMDANFPRSARQTDNSFFYFYFFPIPTSRATRFSPGNVVPAGTGCNKKYADGNKKMATVPLSGGSGSGSLSNSRGSIPGRVVPVTSRASLVAGTTASLIWTLLPTRNRTWSIPRPACPTGTALAYLLFRLAIFFGYCFLYNRRASISRFSLRSMSSSWAERCSSLGSGRRWM